VDGLTGGVGAITLAVFGVVLEASGFHGMSSVCLSLAACLVAYLVYNFHPARVYMGDTGSLLVGFVLGEAALRVSSTIGGFGGIATSFLLVAIPCFEAVFLILIRLSKVTMPFVSTFDHPTQRLIRSGLSVKGAVIRLYVLTAVLAAVAMVCWKGSVSTSLPALTVGLAVLAITGLRLAAVDMAGDGVDGRPGSVFSKNWLVHRIVHKRMGSVAGRARGILVDVGCGSRPYEAMFVDRVDRYIGLDLNPDRYGSGEIDVVSDSTALPVATDSVDTVLSNQVLEHLREPGIAVDEMARILKPGGVAIITAPHIWGVHEEPHDYYRFTQFGLRYLAERAGLRVEAVDALAGFWVTTGARFCYYIERFDRGPLRPVIAIVNYLTQSCAFVLDHLDRVEGDAWNHMMIAVKPSGAVGR
jgi:SAM-dependent methyltransferase